MSCFFRSKNIFAVTLNTSSGGLTLNMLGEWNDTNNSILIIEDTHFRCEGRFLFSSFKPSRVGRWGRGSTDYLEKWLVHFLMFRGEFMHKGFRSGKNSVHIEYIRRFLIREKRFRKIFQNSFLTKCLLINLKKQFCFLFKTYWRWVFKK